MHIPSFRIYLNKLLIFIENPNCGKINVATFFLFNFKWSQFGPAVTISGNYAHYIIEKMHRKFTKKGFFLESVVSIAANLEVTKAPSTIIRFRLKTHTFLSVFTDRPH